MMKGIKNNNWTIITVILLLVAIIYLLTDFKKSIEPFTQSKENKLRELLEDDDDGLNKYLNRIDTQLDTHVDTKNDSDVLHEQQKGLITKTMEFHDKIHSYDLSLGDDTDNKLEQLNKTINDIDTKMRNKKLKEVLNSKFTGLKSQNNGLEVALEPIDLNKYQIKVNNGCLGVTDTGYDVYQCNPNSTSQQFNLRHIYNDYAYKSEATNLNFVEEPKSIKFPFVMVKSVNNNNCVSNNHNNLRVMPCDMVKSQRWNTLNKQVCSK